MRLFLVVLCLLQGCAAASRQVIADLGAVPPRTYFDCDSASASEAWDRAQLWIVRHSHWKIQTATNVLIQTYNSTGSSTSFAYVVTREPLGAGRYRMTIGMACDNIFGCDMPEDKMRSAFLEYVATGHDVLSEALVRDAARVKERQENDSGLDWKK